MNKALVTGGAGFIGSNLVSKLLNDGWDVILYDNLSRAGTKKNLEWLKKSKNSSRLTIVIEDVRREKQVKKYVKKVDVVYHLAAQVAVTSSLDNPREDFEINAGGTLNVLEAARKTKHKPIVVYSSTNKVYGSQGNSRYKEGDTRYLNLTYPMGINEEVSLDFHSPYGCSKGVADQYTRDYYRIFGLPTIVFRQSCIYGNRQMGFEDQGWMAHFIISVLLGRPLTVFGDGKQVRDALYVDDLISAFLKATDGINKTKGEIYNIGGGVKNSISLLEFIRILEKRFGKKIRLKFGKERIGDQKVFISDNSKLEKSLNWKPKVELEEGIEKLIVWVEDNVSLFNK